MLRSFLAAGLAIGLAACAAEGEDTLALENNQGKADGSLAATRFRLSEQHPIMRLTGIDCDEFFWCDVDADLHPADDEVLARARHHFGLHPDADSWTWHIATVALVNEGGAMLEANDHKSEVFATVTRDRSGQLTIEESHRIPQYGYWRLIRRFLWGDLPADGHYHLDLALYPDSPAVTIDAAVSWF